MRARKLPLFHATLEPDGAAVAALAGSKVLAFAGIGDPEKFFATVTAVGIDAPIRKAFPDHHRYSIKEARSLLDAAKLNRLLLLTTEKDAARIQGDAALTELAAQMHAMPVSLTVKESADFRNLVRDVGTVRSRHPLS
jgi:tetraacyldisaccharide 4'-kinase